MKVKLIIVLTLGMIALVGCSTPSYIPPIEPAYTPEPTPEPTIPGGVILPNEPPVDRTWISPGKVNIDNYYAGGRAEYPISIHNGKDTTAAFSVSYRFPDRVADGYSIPTPDVQNWIIIADSTPVLAPKETKQVAIVLEMPEKAINPAPKWEFWISVVDTTQAGFVKTELCSRWLVSMR